MVFDFGRHFAASLSVFQDPPQKILTPTLVASYISQAITLCFTEEVKHAYIIKPDQCSRIVCIIDY